MPDTPEIVPTFRKWLVASRPWSWPASTMPVVFGTSLAVVFGGARLEALRFLLALAAMVVLHSAANMLSDVFDFRRGLDTEVTPVSGAVVRGWLSSRHGGPRGGRVLSPSASPWGLADGPDGPVLLIIGGGAW